MDAIITVSKTVFNPDLEGKAVRIKGYDVDGGKWDRLFLVTEVKDDQIVLVNDAGSFLDIHIENFESDEYLTLTVLKEDVE
jgi:hypothetical protein